MLLGKINFFTHRLVVNLTWYHNNFSWDELHLIICRFEQISPYSLPNRIEASLKVVSDMSSFHSDMDLNLGMGDGVVYFHSGNPNYSQYVGMVFGIHVYQNMNLAVDEMVIMNSDHTIRIYFSKKFLFPIRIYNGGNSECKMAT